MLSAVVTPHRLLAKVSHEPDYPPSNYHPPHILTPFPFIKMPERPDGMRRLSEDEAKHAGRTIWMKLQESIAGPEFLK